VGAGGRNDPSILYAHMNNKTIKKGKKKRRNLKKETELMI
jgi:hypothetical protein